MRPVSEIQVYLVNARIVLAEYWQELVTKNENGVVLSDYEKRRVRIVKALIKTIQYDIDYDPTNLVLINEIFNTLLDYLPADFLSTTYEVHNPQMTQLINQIIVASVVKATDQIFGIVKLSYPADNSEEPIVISESDPKVDTWDEAYQESIVSTSVTKGETYNVSLNQRDASVIPLELTMSHRHIQSSNSNTWVITHNLGYRPSVTVIDLDGDVVNGDITYNTLNQLTLTFSVALSGEAYLN